MFLDAQLYFSMFPFRTVYERSLRHRTLAVFVISSLWHGFYPGYYMMLLSFGLMIEAGRMASLFNFFKTLIRHVNSLFGVIDLFTD